jgi:hypothetical protein
MLVGIDERVAAVLGLGNDDVELFGEAFILDPDNLVGPELDGAVFVAYTAIIPTANITAPTSRRVKASFIDWSFLVAVFAKRRGKSLM